jgi:macrolide phosphotransferase
MELAALASAAIPDLSPTGVVGSPDDPRDFSAAVVLDRQGNRWRVRSPRHEEAAMRLETELQVLSGFTPAVRAALPFRVPSVAGAVRLDGLRTFVYHDMPGRELEIEGLAGLGARGVDDIGRVIAAVHALPVEVVENADLPVYTADQFRQRRLNELDQAATTGRIPALLLRRWENALEEMELWDFTPVVAHGDLHEDNLLVDHGRVVSVTGWTDLHIGDPADDFSWLASSGDQEFTDAVVKAYWQHRTGGTVADEHLMRRAALAAEFALAQWLVRGVAHDDEDMAAEAEAMLLELRGDVEDHGGQEISLAPSRPRPLTTPAAAAAAVAAAEADAAATADASMPAPPSSEGSAVSAAGSHAADQPDDPEDSDEDSDVDGEYDMDDAVITDRDPVDAAEVESADQPSAAGDELDGDEDEPQTSGSHRAEELPTTTLDLDEVRQLRIDRGSDSSS